MRTNKSLAYWKERKVDIREILRTMDKRSGYYGEMQQAYLYACRKEIECETTVLMRSM